MGYFRTVPIELEDAARIDGASRLQTLIKIVLPLCGPGFISAGIFAFTLAQNEFLYALIFLTKTEVRQCRSAPSPSWCAATFSTGAS